MFDYQSLPLWLIFVVSLGLVLVANEIGHSSPS